jgi:uncharacterized protein YciU (UPF0263 family)
MLKIGDKVLVRGYEDKGIAEITSLNSGDELYPIFVEWNKDSLDPNDSGCFNAQQLIKIGGA